MMDPVLNFSTPIFVIWVPGNDKSEYYSKKTINSWIKAGYKNIRKIEGSTADSYQGIFNFSEYRRYRSGKYREWDPVEKYIWESHWKAWKAASKLKRGSIIIEHDALFYRGRKIHPDTKFYPLYSLGVTNSKKKNNAYGCIAACAYWIHPSMAKTLVGLADASNKNPIRAPVDGYIHSQQPWYPWSPISKTYARKYLPVKHFINPDIGTIKEKLLGQYVSLENEEDNLSSVRGEEIETL